VLPPAAAIAQAANSKNQVVLTIGAGDIDCIVEPLKNALEKR
jgi:pheromone shutdown protein TraB